MWRKAAVSFMYFPWDICCLSRVRKDMSEGRQPTIIIFLYVCISFATYGQMLYLYSTVFCWHYLCKLEAFVCVIMSLYKFLTWYACFDLHGHSLLEQWFPVPFVKTFKVDCSWTELSEGPIFINVFFNIKCPFISEFLLNSKENKSTSIRTCIIKINLKEYTYFLCLFLQLC